MSHTGMFGLFGKATRCFEPLKEIEMYSSPCCNRRNSCASPYFIVRRNETPLEFSGYLFRTVEQDDNVVVARKINNCFNKDDVHRAYTFDKKRWTIIPVAAHVAEAGAYGTRL